METVIREGTLRLHTSDTSCDVILSCQGNRLTAHKLILSIASPILRDLLTSRDSEPTNLIFPDVSGSTMSLILDYIYTGSVVLYTDTVSDFLSVAAMLKLKLDEEFLEKRKNFKCGKKEDVAKKEDDGVFSRRNQRKLPNLLPIQMNLDRRKNQKSLCDHVLPNPWRPRISTILLDPKKDYPLHREIDNRVHENDNNNNFHFSSPECLTLPNFFTSAIQEKVFPVSTQSIFSRFHCKENLQLFKNFHGKFEEETNIFNEEKYHSSDSNKSFSSVKLRPNEDISKTSSGELDDDDGEISVGEENVEIDESKTENEGEIDEKTLKCDDGKNKPFVCEDCGKSFSQLRNYKYHRSVHEGTKEFAAKCQECGKIFNDRGYLSSHMKIHRDKKEYACSHCPKRFNQRVAYNMHLRIHTGIKPHECQTCGKSFSRKMLLKQHQRVHTGERPYSCPECGKTFADRSNMSLHARLHTGVKPYACNLCPKSFTKKHHLKTHMNFHTGLKPYSCEKCGLSFSQSSNMRTHYKKCILKGTPSSSSTKTSGINPDIPVLGTGTS